jgi:hypothetical protein
MRSSTRHTKDLLPVIWTVTAAAFVCLPPSVFPCWFVRYVFRQKEQTRDPSSHLERLLHGTSSRSPRTPVFTMNELELFMSLARPKMKRSELRVNCRCCSEVKLVTRQRTVLV